jgi:hypothetical protein
MTGEPSLLVDLYTFYLAHLHCGELASDVDGDRV